MPVPSYAAYTYGVLDNLRIPLKISRRPHGDPLPRLLRGRAEPVTDSGIGEDAAAPARESDNPTAYLWCGSDLLKRLEDESRRWSVAEIVARWQRLNHDRVVDQFDHLLSDEIVGGRWRGLTAGPDGQMVHRHKSEKERQQAIVRIVRAYRRAAQSSVEEIIIGQREEWPPRYVEPCDVEAFLDEAVQILEIGIEAGLLEAGTDSSRLCLRIKDALPAPRALPIVPSTIQNTLSVADARSWLGAVRRRIPDFRRDQNQLETELNVISGDTQRRVYALHSLVTLKLGRNPTARESYDWAVEYRPHVVESLSAKTFGVRLSEAKKCVRESTDLARGDLPVLASRASPDEPGRHIDSMSDLGFGAEDR